MDYTSSTRREKTTTTGDMYCIDVLGNAETAPGEDVLHLAMFKEAAVVAGYLSHFPEATERGYWVSAEAFLRARS